MPIPGVALTPRQRRLADIEKKKKGVGGSCGMHLDLSLKIMEETRFKKKYTSLTKELSKKVQFTFNEIEALLLIYYNVTKRNGPKSYGMSMAQLVDILHNGLDMTDTTLNNYIAPVLYIKIIPGAPGIFSMESWIYALSLFLRGNDEEKLSHCYKVYDVYRTGFLSREIMVSLMTNAMFGEEDPEDAARELLEIVQKKLDIDKDGKISMQDFKTGVRERPMFMEALGPCLPSPYAARAFISTFTHLTGNEYKQEVSSNTTSASIRGSMSVKNVNL